MKTYDSIAARRVAFIGLGVMGYPMAGHLARAGHAVTVYNRSPSKAAAWVAEHSGLQARSAPTPREAALGAEFVFVCVGNDDDLRSVVLGQNAEVFRRHGFPNIEQWQPVAARPCWTDDSSA